MTTILPNGNRLAQASKTQQMSIDELSNITGLSQEVIHSAERGQAVEVSQLRMLKQALGLGALEIISPENEGDHAAVALKTLTQSVVAENGDVHAHVKPKVTPDGEVIRKAMVGRGWDQQGLATEAGLGKRSITRAIAGEEITRATLQAIADALGVSSESLEPGHQGLKSRDSKELALRLLAQRLGNAETLTEEQAEALAQKARNLGLGTPADELIRIHKELVEDFSAFCSRQSLIDLRPALAGFDERQWSEAFLDFGGSEGLYELDEKVFKLLCEKWPDVDEQKLRRSYGALVQLYQKVTEQLLPKSAGSIGPLEVKYLRIFQDAMSEGSWLTRLELGERLANQEIPYSAITVILAKLRYRGLIERKTRSDHLRRAMEYTITYYGEKLLRAHETLYEIQKIQ